MAVLEAQSISSLAVELLTRSVVLPRTVSRVGGEEFAGPNGSTITVRVRSPRTTEDAAHPGRPPSTSTRSTRSRSTWSPSAHLYDAVKSLRRGVRRSPIEDFGGAQVLAPMTHAVAIGAEDQVAARRSTRST